MKKLLLCTTAILSLCYYVHASQPDPGGPVKVFCSQGLSGLVNTWAEGFNNTTESGKVSVTIGTGTQLNGNSISIIEGNFRQGNGEWAMVVGRDVIVPVINAGNPLIARIRSKGLSPENLSLFIREPASSSWGTLLGTDEKEKAGLYVMDDETLVSALSTYLGVDVKTQGRSMVSDVHELFAALERDPLALGFCKMASLINNTDPEFAGKIVIAPIDRNGDGIVDHNEDIYENLQAFSRGVWIGKYPRALTGGIYAVAPATVTETQQEFLNWILNDGQAYLGKSGYTQLLAGERQSWNDRLAALKATVPENSSQPVFATLIYVIVLILIAILLINLVLRFRVREVSPAGSQMMQHRILDESSLILPAGLMFDITHLWSFMEQGGTVKVGIDDYLHHLTGDITRVVMKQKGDFIRKGDEIVSLIRKGKHLTLYSPVSGIIKEKNRKLEDDINVLNISPYDEGWIYRIEPLTWTAENKLLFMADKYREMVSSEILKLKDFLAGFMNKEHHQYATAVLADGGALIDNPLADMGPEVWEEFQIKYIDSAKLH